MSRFKKIGAYLNNFFWLFSTYLLAPCFYFQIFLRRRKKHPQFKILVIQVAKIGDLVCTTPVFREVKKKFPSCHLTVMVTSQTKDILKNNLRVDEIVLITDYPGIRGKIKLIKKLRKDRYDWVFALFPGVFDNVIAFWSLAPNRATTTHKYFGEITKLLSVFSNYRLEYKRHTFLPKHYLNLLKFIGIREYSEEKEMFIRPEEEKKAQDFLNRNSLKRDDLLIGVAVTAGVKLKEWQSEKYAKLADQLIEKLKAKIIFIGSVDDKATVEKIQEMMQNNSVDSCGLFKLNELPAFMKKLKLFIGGDVGPLYIADAAGILLVDILGPIDMYEQSPLHDRCRTVQKDLYCFPCLYSTYPLRYCKEGHLRCLKDISPEDVFEAVVDLIKKYKI